MRIAVDAMGGDFAPSEIVHGAVEAGLGLPGIDRIFLVGDKNAIEAELVRYDRRGKCTQIEIRHCSEVVGMGESPAMAVRKKKDSSIARAVDMVKSGEADAVVSAGNTGAVVVAAMLKLRMLEGVERPAIATVMPTRARPLVLVDAGATTDCTPGILRDFAIMGSVYSDAILGRSRPVIGLLSIGDEDTKGNDITKETFRVLKATDLNFKGNVEGHDLFEGETDVVVCDGFVGNIVLKTSESVACAIAHWMKSEFTRNPVRVLGSVLLKGALRQMKKRMDPEMYGGAQLLGINGICIITHGASSWKAIYHAIRVGCESINQNINRKIGERISVTGKQAVK